MNTHDYDIDDIERFLRGEMKGEELRLFEEKMKKDKYFAEEVNLHKDIMVGANASFRQEMKNELKEVEKKYSKDNIRRFPKWTIISVAASISILIVAGFLFINSNESGLTLYNEYFKPYPNVVNPITRSSVADEQEGFQQYEIGDYQSAISVFEEQLQEDPGNKAVMLYLAISNLMVSNDKQAIDLLKKIVESPSDQFFAPAKWYLGLAYLKTGSTNKAKTIFQDLAKEENSYSEKAKHVLSRM